MIELVIASKNLHKVREYRAMLKQFKHLDLLSLREYPDYLPEEEVGHTFEDNARAKAIHAAKTLNTWVIADDSGLVIPALNNAPGIYSARYAGTQSSDAENRRKLIEEIQQLPEEARDGYYVCCIALASPSGIKKIVTGTCEGKVIIEERGNNGFGYDSIFAKHDYHKTFAELEESQKHLISHRGKALSKLLSVIEALS